MRASFPKEVTLSSVAGGEVHKSYIEFQGKGAPKRNALAFRKNTDPKFRNRGKVYKATREQCPTLWEKVAARGS